MTLRPTRILSMFHTFQNRNNVRQSFLTTRTTANNDQVVYVRNNAPPLASRSNRYHHQRQLNRRRTLSYITIHLSRRVGAHQYFRTFNRCFRTGPVHGLGRNTRSNLITIIINRSNSGQLISLRHTSKTTFRILRTKVTNTRIINNRTRASLSRDFRNKRSHQVARHGQFNRLGFGVHNKRPNVNRRTLCPLIRV